MRRTLARRGMSLHKSRRRDPHALDYGKYWIVDVRRNMMLTDAGDLENIVHWVDNNMVQPI